ncbi:MAG TPA: FG-GAP-like repeat-containing protein [Verrucomicrobiae bacterium]|nr:FG-GAP-like repeat-containing protein [Verrucomicrobiae bacterium]
MMGLRRLVVCLPLISLAASLVAADLRWEAGSYGRRAALPVPSQGAPGFTLMPPGETGVHFTNVLSDARATENQIRLNGAGVALGDVDGDGLCDIYLCGLENHNVLYRNLGNWRFEDVTEAAGVGCEGQYSTGATLADVDGDGHLDLLVNGIGTGTRLFINDGKGHFTESRNSGLLRKYGATTLALADIDGDGDLDLYVANYRAETVRTTGYMILRAGEKMMIRPEDRDRLELSGDGHVLELGEPDALYLNDGHGHFTPVSWTDGRFRDEKGRALEKAPLDWGLTVVCRDLNGDGFPDLYVCDDFQTEDRIWLNDGHGNFRAAPPLTFRHTPSFSMCVDVADINRDGHVDLLVADMLSPRHSRRLMQLAETAPYLPAVGVYEDRPQFDRNALQLNRGDGTFADIAPFAGLAATDWTWMGAFLDVDLDGYEDVLCTTSHAFDTQDLDAEARIRAAGPWPREKVPQKLLLYPRMSQPKQAFRNRGDLTFEDAAAAWGFNQIGVSQGMAFADLDNDGDLDVVVNNLNGVAGLYRNNSSAPRIAVRLKGNPPNTHGIGARIELIARAGEAGGSTQLVQSQEICAGGRYLSSDEPLRVFAADVTHALSNRWSQTHPASMPMPGNIHLLLQVHWRSGRESIIDGPEPNYVYEIAESSARMGLAGSSNPPPAKPWFEDFSARLNHTHHEEPFDDFLRQPLLPRKLSQLGPGVAWFDFDRDGHEDLIIGSGKGGRMAVFHNDGKGGFTPLDNRALAETVGRDQTSVVGAVMNGSEPALLVGSSNYEDGQAAGSMLRVYDLKSGAVSNSFAGQESSTGPLALGDVHGTSRLDLFVGGRCVPGKWPAPATSLLFENRDGKYVLDLTNTLQLANLGMVSGAIFADLNGDGWPDLILACEWGPIRVFLNEHGRLRDATSELGLEPYVGWWHGVMVGDFDGDGLLDIAASNWGLNGGPDGYERPALVSDYHGQNRAGVPLLFWGDFSGSQGVDVIEAEFDAMLGKIVPTRAKPAMEQGLPFVSARFQSYAAYGNASVADVLGDQYGTASKLAAPWLASTVFLNRKGKFEPVVLPVEAQLSPAFGICVADFDGDGNEDLFLAQNFFEVQPQAVRCDAGRGVLLRGNGHGGFESVPGQLSGLTVYGEGRGAAVGDFDEDGRVDLVVGQNGAETRLFHNRLAKPGVRVHVVGPVGNPDGVGAQLRPVFGTRRGPVREIHAGGGYWSQDGATQVFGVPEALTGIWVRWPGGKEQTVEVSAGAKEVLVSQEIRPRIDTYKR